jgi:transcriptional regulator with XRE-family HTH domain
MAFYLHNEPMGKDLESRDVELAADMKLGHKIRARRKARGLSLRELADRAGISPGMISQMERGFTSPSIRTLRLVSAALDTPLPWLLEEDENVPEDEQGVVVRFNRRRAHDLSSVGMIRELLTPDASGNLQMIIIHLQPGCERLDKTKLQDGDEAGLILEGTLQLDVNDKSFILSKGDSFCIPRRTKYNFINVGEDSAEVLWTSTPALY